ncbi:cold-shock protein [Amycolatopsis sp. BJA-103]|uniref:cold-shock protein n=1 Tax=Amycolatopsis sp. BJA-103 TaxID=1911175 RepID=UPI000CA19702|nr:cold shock domain-containing protein [Amycolatopsis sp. BJA-103]AUI59008.1 hypothetical protein BKN51_12845 [Amycolatopsis sp. BJA-103]PNE17543.1 hypothetical protein B1H26_21690 [Amycolatopsis sp. BJA-103]
MNEIISFPGEDDRHETLIADVARVLDSEAALTHLTDTDFAAAHEFLLSHVNEAIDFGRLLSDVVSRANDTQADGPKTRRGTVWTFNVDRGHGYIRPDDGGEDVYFDVRDAEGAMNVGQRVEFEDKAVVELAAPEEIPFWGPVRQVRIV